MKKILVVVLLVSAFCLMAGNAHASRVSTSTEVPTPTIMQGIRQLSISSGSFLDQNGGTGLAEVVFYLEQGTFVKSGLVLSGYQGGAWVYGDSQLSNQVGEWSISFSTSGQGLFTLQIEIDGFGEYRCWLLPFTNGVDTVLKGKCSGAILIVGDGDSPDVIEVIGGDATLKKY